MRRDGRRTRRKQPGTRYSISETTNAIVNKPIVVSKTLWPQRANTASIVKFQ